MPSVVFLRAINVGGANRCKPAELARQLKRFDIVNIGAVGTFVVRKEVSDSTLRAAIAKKLPFKCEIMIVPARSIIKLASEDPFVGQPGGAEITRFVSVLHKPLRSSHTPVQRKCGSHLGLTGHSSLSLPSESDWLLKIITIRDQFVVGLYRRQMKAISYLGKIEKILGVPGTVRNWNTIEKVVKVLKQD